jgi:hypothetical protein
MNTQPSSVKLDIEYLRSIRPHFEILCYGSKIFTPYFQSMITWTQVAIQYGMTWSYNIIANESLITRARNFAASNFLTLEKPTHLIFIDVDQGFNAEEILVLLNHQKDVIVAPVPLKTIPLTYNVNPLLGETIDPTTGLLKLARGGTGCMIIKKEVLENLKKHPEVYQYENDIKFNNDGVAIAQEHLYTFFNTGVIQDEQGRKRFMSEDYDFCEKVKDQGVDIWCDTRLTLTHMGTYNYSAAEIAFTEKRIKEHHIKLKSKEDTK